jgi:hypothetical protein
MQIRKKKHEHTLKKEQSFLLEKTSKKAEVNNQTKGLANPLFLWRKRDGREREWVYNTEGSAQMDIASKFTIFS